MSNQNIFSFTDVTVKKINKTIFENLNFSLKKEEHWAVIGSSGSGKSGLLEAISGKLNILKGTFEHDWLDTCAIQRNEKQPLFSWYHLIEHVTSKHHFKNLSNTTTFYYQQRFNSTDSEDTETVDQYISSLASSHAGSYWTHPKVLEKLNLLPIKDKHLIKLSNGEMKRLLIAAALVKNPVVLLLDHPFTGLDSDTRQYVHTLLSEIVASGISIMMTTSPAEIPDVITHLAVLDEGKISMAVEKKQFNPEICKSSSQELAIDLKELKALVSMHCLPTYDTIVGMEEVVVNYADKIILDHVNWHIKQGERWALLGHNGAGKSTLLSLVNGDHPQAYANNITLFDRKRGSGESIWDIKQKTGFVSPELFQYFPSDHLCQHVIESGFYDTMGLFRKSLSANLEIVQRWMKLLKMEEAATLLFKNTSPSIQRLCLLARALVKHPPLLILDEPCQGLDAEQQKHFNNIINELCTNSKVSMIYVSHYQDELPVCINHTLKLEKGKVILNTGS